MAISITEDKCWFCPLLNKEISEGLCTDINYQRLNFVKTDVFGEIQNETKKTEAEINEICEKCPNLPLN